MIGLFDEVELFDGGRKQFTDFNLADTDLRLWEQFYERDQADHFYHSFITHTPWAQFRRKMYEKLVPDPRLTASYGGSSNNEWTAELLQIKSDVEKQTGIRFDKVLLNYYRDGSDSVAWHSDTLPASGISYPIASVTFGETRVFKVRHKRRQDIGILSIPLTHGSFLLMGHNMQLHYEHHIPKTAKKIGPRINLTFRVTGR